MPPTSKAPQAMELWLCTRTTLPHSNQGLRGYSRLTRILGIDPGSRITGFGVLDFDGSQSHYIVCGCIRVQGETLPERLGNIFEGITTIIEQHQPDELAIEQVFMHKNASSALKLGHARGVALVAGQLRSLSVYEYTPTQIKQSITGRGRGTKEQVQHMVKVLLSLSAAPQQDASDALAVALCHAHIQGTLAHVEVAKQRALS